MTDLHDWFRAWLSHGGHGDLPRDVAVHASACDDCLRMADGLDALLDVDVGMAPAPPVVAMLAASVRMRVSRMAGATAAVGLVTIVAVISTASLMVPDRGEVGGLGASAPPAPGEGVLGVAGAPDKTAAPSPLASPTPKPTPFAGSGPTLTFGAIPPSGAPWNEPPAGTPRPSPTVAPPGSTPTPTSTSSPTVEPTPTPTTPPPTPTPTTPPPTPTPTPSNSPPVVASDAYTAVAGAGTHTEPAPGVLANDSDPDGDPLTALLVEEPTSGGIVLNADGSFTYTAVLGFEGEVTFGYIASDGMDESLIAHVTITVPPLLP